MMHILVLGDIYTGSLHIYGPVPLQCFHMLRLQWLYTHTLACEVL